MTKEDQEKLVELLREATQAPEAEQMAIAEMLYKLSSDEQDEIDGFLENLVNGELL